MEILAAPVAICSTCHEPLTAKSECLACLLRVGLDDLAPVNGSPEAAVFGDFEIARHEDGSFWELGCGAMGVTYRAVDKMLHRTVALKVIETLGAGDSKAVRARFLREARAAASLRHPNVASVFQFGAAPEVDRCYYAMELVEGETLEARVRQDGPLKPELVLEIAIQVTRALMAAAAQGLIHRDLKPANIMLTPNDTVPGGFEAKVIDFGLAKSTVNGVGERDLTHGGFVGTPTFASPEQLGGAPVDARSDIYSLGATLWYALSGEIPCPGKTIEEIRNSQTQVALPIEQLTSRNVPASLIALLQRTLAADSARRPAAPRELLPALESCREQLTSPDKSVLRHVGRGWAMLIAVAAIVAGGFFTFQTLPRRAASSAPPPEKSIAVLPFENLSDDKENAYFAAGIQDDVLTSLAQIHDLKVISRTSVMAYQKPGARNMREIGQSLGVATALEGSVRRVGDRVVVNVQLVDTRTDQELWAHHYDDTLSDSLGLQGELANEIATALRAKLAPQEKARLGTKPTDNPEAYVLYLEARGREGVVNQSVEDITAAEQLYAQAIALDPKFALAHARFSLMNSYLARALSTHARKEKARAAAEEALRLLPSLGEAHLALGLCYYWGDRDYATAFKELSIAAETLPNEPYLFYYISGIYRAQGRWREALATTERAQERDPRNREAFLRAADNYLFVRDWTSATSCYQRALTIAPDSVDATISLAYIDVFRDGNPAAGRKLLQRIPTDIDPDGIVTESRWDLAMLARKYADAARILANYSSPDFPRAGTGAKAFLQGRTALARGDAESAQRYFAAAAPGFEAVARDNPNDVFRHTQLGLLYAYMHRQQEALRESRRAVELQPPTRDALLCARAQANLALVYGLLGEQDQAINLIESLLSTPGPLDWPDFPQSITLADLRLRWEWDGLRSNPRFQKIVAGPEPKTVLTTIPSVMPVAPEKSIAVLPFENLSDDKENAYFAAGMQDEILSDLAQIADLKVISRTSVMRYQSRTPRNLREIAQALGVANIVEGSVQRDRRRVRVVAQLIDARTGTHRWSKTYDRELADIFALQDEIARQIAQDLQAKIAPQEKALIAEKPTSDLTAYAFYERGRALDMMDLKDRQKCVVLLEEAVRRDPNFLLAQCRLAEAYVRLYAEQDMESEDERVKSAARARQAIETALRLRPDRGEPHLASAQYFFMTFQGREARRELEIVSRLMPNDSEALFLEARLDRRENRWDESVIKARRAAELDPHNEFFVMWTADTYLNLRRYREGEKFVGEFKMRNPAGAKRFDSELARFKLAQGGLAEALALSRYPTDETGLEAQFSAAFFANDYPTALRIIAEAPPDLVEQTFCLKSPESGAEAQVFRARGEREKAQRIFQKLRQSMEDHSANTPRNEWYFANCSGFDAALGRTDDAIREAQKAVEMHPIAQDPINGTTMVVRLAKAYTAAGDRDRALEQLEMLAKIPSDISYGELRFNPAWDPLQGDPRFEQMVASLKPNFTASTQ